MTQHWLNYMLLPSFSKMGSKFFCAWDRLILRQCMEKMFIMWFKAIGVLLTHFLGELTEKKNRLKQMSLCMCVCGCVPLAGIKHTVSSLRSIAEVMQTLWKLVCKWVTDLGKMYSASFPEQFVPPLFSSTNFVLLTRGSVKQTMDLF